MVAVAISYYTRPPLTSHQSLLTSHFSQDERALVLKSSPAKYTRPPASPYQTYAVRHRTVPHMSSNGRLARNERQFEHLRQARREGTRQLASSRPQPNHCKSRDGFS